MSIDNGGPTNEWINLSIVNATFDDPMGSSYSPPSPDRPYWLDPRGHRVTVSEVWAGADNETRRLIYEKTMKCFNVVYNRGLERALDAGTIFRGGEVEELLAEIRGQLGPGHWKTGKGT